MNSKNLQKAFLGIPLALGTVILGGIAIAQQPGGTPDPSTSPTSSPSISATPSGTSQPGQTQRSVFDATFIPANLSGVSGTATLIVQGNSVGVYLSASGLAPSIAHAVHIHAGSQCAGPGADTNFDGYVDGVEGSVVSGPPIIPLALELLQSPGGSLPPAASATFPSASRDGTLSYIGSIPVSAVSSALNSAGVRPSPSISPAAGTTGLSSSPVALDAHVIEIHGISPDVQLPSSVRSAEPAMSPAADLPVACAQIIQVE